MKNQLTDLRGEAYYDTLSRILGQCGKNIVKDAIAMKPITALTIGHLALLYQLPYKAVCEWLEENKAIPTGSYDELIRRGLKVGEVFDIVKEQYTLEEECGAGSGENIK